MSVRSVGSPSLRSHILSSIRESTRGRSPTSARSVGKALSRSHNSRHIRRHTPRREKLANSVNSEPLRELTLGLQPTQKENLLNMKEMMPAMFFFSENYQQMCRKKFFDVSRQTFTIGSTFINIRWQRLCKLQNVGETFSLEVTLMPYRSNMGKKSSK